MITPRSQSQPHDITMNTYMKPDFKFLNIVAQKWSVDSYRCYLTELIQRLPLFIAMDLL